VFQAGPVAFRNGTHTGLRINVAARRLSGVLVAPARLGTMSLDFGLSYRFGTAA